MKMRYIYNEEQLQYKTTKKYLSFSNTQRTLRDNTSCNHACRGRQEIPYIRFFPLASIFRYVRENIKVVKNVNLTLLQIRYM